LAACGTTIHVCVQTLRALVTLMAPFLPHCAEKARATMNLPPEALSWDQATAELPAGHPIREPQILVKKLESA